MWRNVFKNLKISVYEFSSLTALARYQNYILNHMIMVIFRKNWDRKSGREKKKATSHHSFNSWGTDIPWLETYSGWAFSGLLTDGRGGGWGKQGPLPKICYTYPAMVKLCTVIPYKTHHLSSPNKCCYIKIYRYKLHFNTKFLIQNSFHFSWLFKDFFNKHSWSFDDVSKNDYPRLFLIY